MSVALNANTPASKIGNATTAPTTVAFNAPANSYLTALVACDNTGGAATGTVTDNRSGTWVMHKRSNGGLGGCEVWGRYVPFSETGLTVTCTFVNAFNSAADAVVTVLVLTGAGSKQPGTIAFATGTVDTVALVPQNIGSMVVGTLSRSAAATTYAANAQTTFITNNSDATSGSTQVTFRGAAVTSSLASVTYGSSSTAQTASDIIAIEILPSNGLPNNYMFVTVGNGMSVSEKIR